MSTLTVIAVLVVGLLIGVGIGLPAGRLWAQTRATDDAQQQLTAQLTGQATQAELVREGLARLGDQLSDLHTDRARWQTEFNTQIDLLRRDSATLQGETRSLSTALRRPQVRGQWGELHLQRAVELAGLVERCDFTTQEQLAGGTLRPDLVVHLAGGRQIAVDAKVSLEAFLDATATDDPAQSSRHLARHAEQVRTHARTLGAKTYWRELSDTCEFVVMFLPSEAILQAALEVDSALIEYAAQRQVVIATPSTLIALLRTVATGWSQQRLAEQAHEVQRLGRELHERLGSLGDHFAKVGRALESAMRSYNSAMGSLESRVMVSARRFSDLGVTDRDLPEITQLVLPHPVGEPTSDDSNDAFSARRTRGA